MAPNSRTTNDTFDDITGHGRKTHIYCDHCGIENENDDVLVQCGRCRVAHYCSTKCFSEAQPEHLKVCGRRKSECIQTGRKHQMPALQSTRTERHSIVASDPTNTSISLEGREEPKQKENHETKSSFIDPGSSSTEATLLSEEDEEDECDKKKQERKRGNGRSLRPSMIRGNSFIEDPVTFGDGGSLGDDVPEEESRQPRRASSRPGVVRGYSNSDDSATCSEQRSVASDDSIDVLENETEQKHPRNRLSLRPGVVRGYSFENELTLCKAKSSGSSDSEDEIIERSSKSRGGGIVRDSTNESHCRRGGKKVGADVESRSHREQVELKRTELQRKEYGWETPEYTYYGSSLGQRLSESFNSVEASRTRVAIEHDVQSPRCFLRPVETQASDEAHGVDEDDANIPNSNGNNFESVEKHERLLHIDSDGEESLSEGEPDKFDEGRNNRDYLRTDSLHMRDLHSSMPSLNTEWRHQSEHDVKDYGWNSRSSIDLNDGFASSNSLSALSFHSSFNDSSGNLSFNEIKLRQAKKESKSYGWERPEWALKSPLRKSRKGQVLKKEGNLLTNNPKIQWKKPDWATNNPLRSPSRSTPKKYNTPVLSRSPAIREVSNENDFESVSHSILEKTMPDIPCL